MIAVVDLLRRLAVEQHRARALVAKLVYEYDHLLLIPVHQVDENPMPRVLFSKITEIRVTVYLG